MDSVDRQLLNALRANARATYAELARVVGLSAPAAHERVGKLEAAGVITGYHAAIAPESLGYAVNALIGIFITDSADTDDITAALEAIPVVEDCWFVAGEETFLIKVCVADVAGIEGTIRALNAIPGVARTRTTVVLSTKFEDRVPPEGPADGPVT
ncbi:Lrp/AsnC family transcriptional regulator [uncultured Jatrophihabitans sp.]|uniref:Lrp/AsnC family transcriptional regulator n=1 Tax=uncultured Jatrophihabitans sp. TaxID=1610747 RepID=UPI0035C9DE43